MDDYKHIRELANQDVDTLQRKNEEYGSSWRKRGGIGAFMMLARKWDRLETQCGERGYDIFKTIEDNESGVLDDIRDLRAYLLLVESHMTAPKEGWDPAQVGGDTTVRSVLSDEERTFLQNVASDTELEGEPGPGYVNQG